MKFLFWDVVSIKKQDQQEAQRFVNTVHALIEIITDGLDTMETIHEYGYDTMTHMNELLFNIQTIKTLTVLYEDNKFSRPFASIKLINLNGVMESQLKRYHAMISRYQFLQSQVAFARKQVQPIMDEYEECDNEFETKFQNMDTQLDNICLAIGKQHDALTSTMLKLLTAVQYDMFRITSGVDIIRSHRSLNKRFPNGKAIYEFKMIHQRPRASSSKEV